jgi:hypothetical protein
LRSGTVYNDSHKNTLSKDYGVENVKDNVKESVKESVKDNDPKNGMAKA